MGNNIQLFDPTKIVVLIMSCSLVRKDPSQDGCLFHHDHHDKRRDMLFFFINKSKQHYHAKCVIHRFKKVYLTFYPTVIFNGR